MRRHRLSYLKRAIIARKWRVARSRKPAENPSLSRLDEYSLQFIVPVVGDALFDESPIFERLMKRRGI